MNAYHLGISRDDLRGAEIALLPGDPFRVPRIAEALDDQPIEVAHHREFRSAVADLHGTTVLVTSTGIGGASAAIAIEELASLGVRTFLRVGTTGAIQPSVEVGDLIVAAGAVRLDGASSHYAPLSYPAVADHGLVNELIASAASQGLDHHVGLVVSSDTFYPGQERYDSFTGYVPLSHQGTLEEWKRLGCLSYEMETATLFTVTRTMGLSAGAVLGVIVNRSSSEAVDPEVVADTEDRAIRCAAGAVRRLVEAG